MLRLILMGLVLMCLGHAVVWARPPIDIAELRRLDGVGARAWEKFRAPDTRCGIHRDGSAETKIYNNFDNAILTLDFSGVRRRILPLMITDKQGEENTLKHKVRVACVLSFVRSGADYLLQMTTRIEPPGVSAVLRIDAEGRVLNLAGNAGLFYVVGENSRGNRAIDRFHFLRGRLARFTCRLGETGQDCEYQFLNYSERVFSDEIRHQAFWPDASRRSHHDTLNAAITARISDPVTLALHRLIIANESATISPFQIWDAVLGDSGISFGPHQWDIGINADGQRIFRKIAAMPSLNARLPNPSRYFKSVRRFSTGDLQSLLMIADDVNAALQSPDGQDVITREYIKWLETDALTRARASLPFLDAGNPIHQIMLLYYVDVDNQYGAEDFKASLRGILQGFAASGASLQEIRKGLDAHMMTTPFAISYPDKAAARLERTWHILAPGMMALPQ